MKKSLLALFVLSLYYNSSFALDDNAIKKEIKNYSVSKNVKLPDKFINFKNKSDIHCQANSTAYDAEGFDNKMITPACYLSYSVINSTDSPSYEGQRIICIDNKYCDVYKENSYIPAGFGQDASEDNFFKMIFPGTMSPGTYEIECYSDIESASGECLHESTSTLIINKG